MTSAPILPATVAAAHLGSCAAELAGAEFDGMDDVRALVPVLARAQRQLAVALVKLAHHTDGGSATGTRGVDLSAPVTELAEVMFAAADAADATADALDEAVPLLADPADGDTRS